MGSEIVLNGGCGGFGDVALRGDAVQKVFRSNIGGHDQNCVLEVHGAALRVGDTAVVQHLKENVEDIGMGLFNLVEEHHGVGLTAHSLGELAALLVAHVSRRSSDKSGYGEFLHVLGHVDPDHVVLVVEKPLCQGLGKFRLAYACGAEEEEGTYGFGRILDAGLGPDDGVGDSGHRLILADDSFVEIVSQVQDLFALALCQLGYGDAGPSGYDAGDLVLCDRLVDQTQVLALDSGLFFGQFFFYSGKLAVFQLRGLLQVVAPLGILDLAVQVLPGLSELGKLVN